jgi:hypothetical protein
MMVCGLLEWTRICAGCFYYICFIVVDPIIKGWDHIQWINTNNINKTRAILQTIGGKDEPNIVCMQNFFFHDWCFHCPVRLLFIIVWSDTGFIVPYHECTTLTINPSVLFFNNLIDSQSRYGSHTGNYLFVLHKIQHAYK